MNEQQPAGEVQKSQKKPFYKKWWLITIIIVVVLLIIGSSGEDKNQKESQTKNASQTNEQTNVDNSIAENNQEEKPVAPSNESEFKKSMMEALKTGIGGYNSSKNAFAYALSQNYSQAIEETEKAKNEYTDAIEKLNSLTPPDKYKKLHSLTTDAIEKFNQSNNLAKNGIIQRDTNSIERAGELLDEGNELIAKAQKELPSLNAK